MIYNIKSIATIPVGGQLAVTDVDTKSRTVEGYFSIFGNIDSDGDMIMPGAYTKTLKENGPRIKHLLQHDVRYPLARPELQEDSIGLKFRSVISDTSYGRDTIKLYEDKVIDEHSVGIKPVKKQAKSTYREITEVKLWEGSSVTWGANEYAHGGMAKSMGKEDILKRMDDIYKALRNGRYESEAIFEALDVYHAQLKQLLYDLANPTHAAEEAHEPVETKQDDAEITNKIDSLIKLFN